MFELNWIDELETDRHNAKIEVKLIKAFADAFIEDDEPLNKKGIRLLNTYNNVCDSDKALIDDLFITLCGYSCETLLSESQEQ